MGKGFPSWAAQMKMSDELTLQSLEELPISAVSALHLVAWSEGVRMC